MTAASGHLNQSPIAIETPHFTYPPTKLFWLSLISGSQVLNRWGKGQWMCQVVTVTLDNIRCQKNWSTLTKAGKELGQPVQREQSFC